MSDTVREDKRTWIAHTSEVEGQESQRLQEHLQQVSALAQEFGRPFHADTDAALCGLYHDIGKYSSAFQRYIRGERKTRVDHSTAGAQELLRHGGIVQGFCIAGHHAGLPDMGSSVDAGGIATLCGRSHKKISNDYMIYRREIPEPAVGNGPNKMMRYDRQHDYIAVMLYIRMVFSCLVDADFLDTEAYMRNGDAVRGNFDAIPELEKQFFQRLEEKGFFQPVNSLNEQRCAILKRCIAQGEHQPGLFTLTVPTGGGKTIASMAFALCHAVRHHKRRIIYVIPYTAIIEQTADVFRQFLPDRDIIEHHSGAAYDDENEEEAHKKLATENWDAPIIITTNVQFFESLFANKTSRCRKLHNIANSVIIFDEAQMFPLEYLRPVCKTIELLIAEYGCTGVLCSATQPALNEFFCSSVQPCEIMENIPGLYHFFRRVTFHNEGICSYDEIAEAVNRCHQVLCIATTKKEAYELYRNVREDSFYLSTNLYPHHRRQVIQEIKRRLKAGEPCRVVSTSVISVGVDIDFPTVYLEISGLDSLIQGAGRCNREGKQTAEDSIVHVFQTQKGMASPFMKMEKQITALLMQNGEDISAPDMIHAYFQHLYHDKGEDALDAKHFIKRSEALPFHTFAGEMHMIDSMTKSVFIAQNEEAQQLAETLRLDIRSRHLLRQANQYIVQVRCSADGKGNSLFEQLYRAGKIELFPGDTEMALLVDTSIYDEKMGLLYEEAEGDYFMI